MTNVKRNSIGEKEVSQSFFPPLLLSLHPPLLPLFFRSPFFILSFSLLVFFIILFFHIVEIHPEVGHYIIIIHHHLQGGGCIILGLSVNAQRH